MPWFTDKICINVIYGDINHPHSHPWSYFTLILWGGYIETICNEKSEKSITRRPGYFGFRSYDAFHRLKLLKSKAITLFIRTKNKTRFGFAKYLVDGKVITDVMYWKNLGIDIKELKKA